MKGNKSFSLRSLHVPIILFLAAFIARLPFRSQALYVWDSVNYALALDRFDIFSHQPHPPGYIVYVFLGKLANFFLQDPNSAYISISIFSSALAVVFVYLLAREMESHSAGLWASVLLLSSPLFWLYGGVALPYTVEALVSAGVAYFCWKSVQGAGWAVFVSAALLGIGSGMRPQLLFFLLPLWLYSLWKKKSRRTAIFSACLLCLTILAWLFPTARLSGGITKYLQICSGHVLNFFSFSPVLFLKIALKFTLAAFFALGAGTVILVFVLGSKAMGWWKHREPVIFLAAWALWPMLFMAFIMIGHGGHVCVFLPALCILLGTAGPILTANLQSQRKGLNPFKRLFNQVSGRRFQAAGLIGIFIINSAIFACFPLWWKTWGVNKILKSIYLQPLNRSARVVQAWDQYLEENLSEENPALITLAEDIGSLSAYRLAMYHFPQIPVYQLDLEDPERGYLYSFNRQDIKNHGTAIELPDGIDSLVFLVAGEKEILAQKGLCSVSGEVWIYSLSMDQEDVQIGPYTFIGRYREIQLR